MKTDYIAIMLSILALAISLIPALNSVMTFDEPTENQPSFDMPVTQYHGNLILGPITTSFFIVNNGSAAAHDVDIIVYYNAHSYDIYLEQHVLKLEQGEKETLYFPVGYRQLEMAWGNTLNYTVTIWITCREAPNAQRFEFIMH